LAPVRACSENLDYIHIATSELRVVGRLLKPHRAMPNWWDRPRHFGTRDHLDSAPDSDPDLDLESQEPLPDGAVADRIRALQEERGRLRRTRVELQAELSAVRERRDNLVADLDRQLDTWLEQNPSVVAQIQSVRWRDWAGWILSAFGTIACMLLLPARVHGLVSACRDAGGSCPGLWAAQFPGVAPSWSAVLLPLTLSYVHGISQRARTLLDSARLSRMIEDTRLADLRDHDPADYAVAATRVLYVGLGFEVSECLSLLLALYHLETGALSGAQVCAPLLLMVGVYGLVLRTSSVARGLQLSSLVRLDFSLHRVLLVNLALWCCSGPLAAASGSGEPAISFALVMWPVWLQLSCTWLAVAIPCVLPPLLLLSSVQLGRGVRAGALAVWVGATVMLWLIRAFWAALADVAMLVDGGAPLQGAATVAERACYLNAARTALSLCLNVGFQLLAQRRCARVGLKRQQRMEGLSTDLPQLLVRQSSSLYRLAGRELVARYWKRQAPSSPSAQLPAASDGATAAADDGAETLTRAAPFLDPEAATTDDGPEDVAPEAVATLEAPRASAAPGGIDEECRYCEAAPQECVFLPCGHAGVCIRCATRWLEENSTCPDCRAEVQKLARLGPLDEVAPDVLVATVQPALPVWHWVNTRHADAAATHILPAND